MKIYHIYFSEVHLLVIHSQEAATPYGNDVIDTFHQYSHMAKTTFDNGSMVKTATSQNGDTETATEMAI